MLHSKCYLNWYFSQERTSHLKLAGTKATSRGEKNPRLLKMKNDLCISIIHYSRECYLCGFSETQPSSLEVMQNTFSASLRSLSASKSTLRFSYYSNQEIWKGFAM